MHKFLITFLILVSAQFCFSQNVEIIKKSDKEILTTGNDFAFLEAKTDVKQLEFVATIKATTAEQNSNIGNLYYSILQKAKNIGANSFKLISYTQSDSTKEFSLILDTYLGNDSLLNENFANHEKNVVYVFCDEKTNGEKTYSFKVDGEKKRIKSGTYFKKEIKEGEEIKINKGGITGMSIWINWKPNRSATFFTFTGLGLGGGNIPNGVIGASFNTGRISNIEGDLGSLLAQILKISD